jgi:hypothetical protein
MEIALLSYITFIFIISLILNTYVYAQYYSTAHNVVKLRVYRTPKDL